MTAAQAHTQYAPRRAAATLERRHGAQRHLGVGRRRSNPSRSKSVKTLGTGRYETGVIKHRPGCRSRRCDHRVDVIWGKHHRPRARTFDLSHAAHFTVDSTCYHEGTITASGSEVYVGEVANNFLPLGTHIRLDRAVFGRRDFVILDHIGWGSELDIYGPSESACEQYGRQTMGFWQLR